MNIAYGKPRLAWYMLFGALGGVFLILSHELISWLWPDVHALIMLVLVPVLVAAGAAAFARQENSLFNRTQRLEAARARTNDLILGTMSKRQRMPATSFTDDRLCTCWERLGCAKEDCPAYGMEHARCWLIAGTFCRGEVQGQFARKLEDCRLCEVYRGATADPVDEITENFYAMNYMLGEREEQLEEAYQEARAKSEKLAGLVSMSEAALSSMHLGDLLQNLLESAASFVGADLGMVYLADSSGEQLTVRASFGFKPGGASRMTARTEEGIIGQAFAGRYIAVSEDLPTDSRQTNPYLKSVNAKTLICLPLYSREKPIGILSLATLTPHHYTAEEKDSLCVAADRIAVAVENARLAGELGRDREQAEFVESITADVGAGNGITSFYDSFVMHASRLMDFEQSCMIILQPESGEIEIVAVRTEAPRTWLTKGLRLPVESLPVVEVIKRRRPVVRDVISGDEYPTDKLLLEEGIRSAVLFPLLSKGEVLGVLQLGSMEPHAFDPEEVELLEPVTRQLGLLLDNIRIAQDAERSSLIDRVTQLYSHRYFYEVLKREIAVGRRYNRPVSLIMIHLNGFRKFSDSFGSEAGEMVLREVADILRRSVRDVDVVARYGGIQFSILLPEVNASGGEDAHIDAVKVANRVRDQVAGRVLQNEKWAGGSLSLSLGIAEFSVHAVDTASLLEKADWALRTAKEKGANEVIVAR
ncbi:MAG: diguanylate cyclase [Thermoleophilia bacterium]|nr:diguanylate cyclase [Thermoleophilia bacterium]